MSIIIDNDRLRNICKVGQGFDCCRYIIANRFGIQCAKHNTELREIIDRKVAMKEFTARADNCEGLVDVSGG